MKQIYTPNRSVMSTSYASRLFRQSGILLLLLMLLSVCVQAQRGDSNSNRMDADKLIGTWEFDFTKSRANVESKRKNQLNAMDAQSKAQVRANYEGRQYTFKVNGDFVLKLKNGNETSGSWELNPEGTELTFKFASGLEQVYRLTGNARRGLILRIQGDQKKTLIFSQMHLTKQ